MAIGAMDQLYVDQMKNNVETIMEHIEEMLPEQVFSLPDYSTWIRDHETDEAIFYKMPYSIEILNDGDGYTIIDIEAQGEDFKFTKATFGNMIILNSHNKDKNSHTLGTPHQHIATMVYCISAHIGFNTVINFSSIETEEKMIDATFFSEADVETSSEVLDDFIAVWNKFSLNLELGLLKKYKFEDVTTVR